MKRRTTPTNKAGQVFSKFCATVAKLRDPKDGCPWDLQQTHATLRRYMLEEAYEACEVMKRKSSKELCGELGDVLLQVVLNAQLAADQGAFTIEDVVNDINAKMLRRHPHVFQPAKTKYVSDKQLRADWDAIKAQEKKGKSKPKGVFHALRNQPLPATLQAFKIGSKAAEIDFDWDDVEPVLQQLESEIKELRQAWKKPTHRKHLSEEIGDVYFSLAQVCRHLDLNPELIAIQGNKKFLDRFALLEKIAAEKKIDVSKAGNKVLNTLWNLAKKKQKR